MLKAGSQTQKREVISSSVAASRIFPNLATATQTSKTKIYPKEELPSESSAIAVTKRYSRDEMNLAEFPLAVLSTRHDSSVKTLEFSDSLTGKNGERIERKWVITGADKFGLPTSSDDEVLLGLLRLSASQEFRDRKVTFTRYELLRILKWSTEGRSYGRLQRALDRLSGVRIKTSNGFFDNSSKSHQTRNFGIIDAYELNDGRGERTDSKSEKAHAEAVKPSFFVWSEAMFSSFQSGFIKKLDLDFLLGLKSAVSKRLYRFLDKHFWYRSKVQYNLFTLAHEKIGISRNYSYASQLKQQLEPAIEELIENGFLQGCEFIGKGNDTEIILVAGAGNRRSALPQGGTQYASTPSDTAQLNRQQEAGSGFKKKGSANTQSEPKNSKVVFTEDSDTNPSGGPSAETIVNALAARGLALPQAQRLVSALSHKQLSRATYIIEHFDQLISSDSSRISKNPAGFLYRAIERVDNFVLPGERLDNSPKVKTAKNRGATRSQNKLEDEMIKEVFSDREAVATRKAQLATLKEQVEPHLLERIRLEVTKGLEKLRGIISDARFEETVEHAVEQKLAKLLAI